MLNMDGFIKLTADEVVWSTHADGEPQWKAKNPEPDKNYCLMLSKVESNAFSTQPLLRKTV